MRGRKGECEGESVREEGRVRGRKGGWEGEGEKGGRESVRGRV